MNRGMASPYISVREKNMKLLLSASATFPRLLCNYYSVIRHGLLDRGVSVRRVSAQLVETLMKLLMSETPTREGRATLLSCVELVLSCLLKEGDSYVRTSLVGGVVCVLCECELNENGFELLKGVCSEVARVVENQELLKAIGHGMLASLQKQRVTKEVDWLLNEKMGNNAMLVTGLGGG